VALKVGILGSGNAAAKHCAAFAELPDLWQLTDVADADVVSICTPPYSHFSLARDTLAATFRRHAIVEKPLCGSLAECDKLAELERITGNRVFPIFQYRFAEHDALTNQMILHFVRPPTWWNGWRGKWDTALGGCLTSHGVHLLDLILHTTKGRPIRRLMAKVFTGRFADVETGADIIVEPVTRETRALSVVVHPNAAPSYSLGDSHAGYVAQFRDIHRAITSGAEPTVTLAQARQSIELLTACYKSAYLGEPVTLPIEPDDPWYRGWTPFFAQRARQTEPSPRISEQPDRQDAQPA
jgi:predicted dehydrogenase